MSSLRNAFARRQHKERSQPSTRKHLGLLEKKKDYKERSENYKKRSARLNVLEKKARERNPDEYARGMTKGPVTRAEAKKSHREIAKMKDEDLKIVTMRKVIADRKVEKLQANLHDTAGAPTMNEHTFFDNDDELVKQKAKARNFGKNPKDGKKQLRRAYKRFDTALEQKDATAAAYQTLQTEKIAMTAKGKKRKVQDAQDGQPAIYKWKKQRRN